MNRSDLLEFDNDGFPIVEAYQEGNGLIIDKCLFCGKRHYHGLPGGHVSPHCIIRHPIIRNGYMIKVVDKKYLIEKNKILSEIIIIISIKYIINKSKYNSTPWYDRSKDININFTSLRNREIFNNKQIFNKFGYPAIYLRYNYKQYLCRIQRYGIQNKCIKCHKKIDCEDIRIINTFNYEAFCLSCIEKAKSLIKKGE